MIALLLSVALAAPAPAAAPRCEKTQDLVVLWHKETPSVARATVTHALADACFKVAEQFEGTRREATEMAALLQMPLLNVKALREESETGAPAFVIGLDVIDTASDELLVLVSAEERTPAPAKLDAKLEAKAWRAQRPLFMKAFERVKAALSKPAR
jgi:hypothetical protein